MIIVHINQTNPSENAERNRTERNMSYLFGRF